MPSSMRRQPCSQSCELDGRASDELINCFFPISCVCDRRRICMSLNGLQGAEAKGRGSLGSV